MSHSHVSLMASAVGLQVRRLQARCTQQACLPAGHADLIRRFLSFIHCSWLCVYYELCVRRALGSSRSITAVHGRLKSRAV